MAIFVYDAAQHFLTIGGFSIRGFQDGSSVELSYDGDRVTRQVDVDGVNVVFNRSNNRLATVTFTLNEGSPANAYLSQMAADFAAGNGGVETLFFKDGNSGSTGESDGCVVQSLPGVGGGAESSGREWVIGTGQMRVKHLTPDAAI